MQKAFRYVHENKFPELKDKMWPTFSKSDLDEASKALNFSYNNNNNKRNISNVHENLKSNSGYQTEDHWSCDRRK